LKDETQSALYNESVHIALSTLSTTVIKTNQLLTYKVKFAFCSEIRTNH